MSKDLLQELVDAIAQTRGEKGCPWDQKQTFQSLRKHVLEEAQEVVDAIDQEELFNLKGELGDLLLQVVFLARLAEEKKLFTLDEVIGAIIDKLKRRKPHVFEAPQAVSLEQAYTNWHRVKAQDKQLTDTSLSQHLQGTSPLTGALRLNQEAAKAGFEWPSREAIYEKIKEELLELEQAAQSGQESLLEEELGDLLLVCTSLASKLGIDPQVALMRACRKFCKRYDQMQKAFQGEFFPSSTQEWTQVWHLAKIRADEPPGLQGDL